MSKIITDDCMKLFITNHYGKTDISGIGDGTATGAISALNNITQHMHVGKAADDTTYFEGYVDASGFSIDNNSLNNIYEPKINRNHITNDGCYYKDGYTCHLHAWWVEATSAFFTIWEQFRPKTAITATGFCIRKDNSAAYPILCELETTGRWQVWAMTAIGTSGGGGLWKMYDSTTDHRSEFSVCVSASWLTDTNGR